MVLSDYTKQQILSLHWQGCKVSQIVERLVLEEAITVSKQGVRKFLKHFPDRRTIARKPGSGYVSKICPQIMQIIERAMRQDDETTTTQLQMKLAENGLYISLAMIVRARQTLGWIYRGSAYCQLIREVNTV